MKKTISWLLVIALCISIMPISAAADNGTFILPRNTTEVADEAFMGDTSITTLVIPKNVESIGQRAFADCTNLREVYLGKNYSIQIARDAFQGCSNLHFYVYPQTRGELYAMAHGFPWDLLEAGSSFLDRAMALVAENGGSTILQGGEFASKRLIVCRGNSLLPDISKYDPTEILYDEDVFIVQFDSVDNTSDCYTMLLNDPQTIFVEPDECIEVLDDVFAQGVVDPSIWEPDDPMGFDVYSQFVAENGSGSVTIAIVDSGVSNLSSYTDRLRSDGINMLQAQDNQHWSADYNRHGSVIASVINDCVSQCNGENGKPKVWILPVRVIGASGNADFTLIGNGIKYAVSHGATIINLSMNFKESAYVKHCIDDAVTNHHATVVVAAGNSSRNISNVFPAKLDNVITVSGLGPNYTLSATSNYGIGVNYCAPDSYVKTLAYSNSLFNGTSFAAPMIASAFALLQLDPRHNIDDLNNSCYLSNDTDSPANSYGNGMPQLDRLAFVPVERIEFDTNLPNEIAVGEDVELRWTVWPADATDKTVTVTTSDSNILAVEKDGNTEAVCLKALSTGDGDATIADCTITLTSESSDVSAQRLFTVVRPVTSITIQGAVDRLPIQRTLRLEAVVSPGNATSKGIEWFSTNPAVATISQSGLITPVTAGTAGFKAKATDGYGAESEVVNIEFIDQPDAESVELYINEQNVTNGSYTMQPGNAVQLNASVLPADADQSVTYIAGGTYFTVSETGLITATEKGTGASVIVMSKNGIQAIVVINVIVPPASVSISGESVVNEGNTITLTATVLPEDANDRTVTWSSDNPSVATVSSSGVVTGIHTGTATIQAASKGDSPIIATKTITVRHPYSIIFNLNADGDQTASTDMSLMTAYSGDEIGILPRATRDYYTFDGWYNQANGGVKYSPATELDTSENSVTLYAHWTLNPLSDWVLTSEVPSDGTIIESSYSYRESVEDTSSEMEGWIADGSYWKQVGSGSTYYASFPSGFDTGHSIYTSFAKSAPTYYENSQSKREVSNSWAGYVYWHWMYDCGGYGVSSQTDRAIYYQKGQSSSAATGSSYNYQFFGAFTSTKNYTALNGQNWNQGSGIYKWYVVDVGDRSSYADTQGTRYWYRFDYYRSTYTDYTKYYKYYRDIDYQVSDPGDGENISNKVMYVKYRLKHVEVPSEVYTITYRANNENGGYVTNLPGSQTKEAGIDLILSSKIPTREGGYSFLGWATSADSNTVEYQPGDIFSVDAETVLYAVWRRTSVNVTYYYNDGSNRQFARVERPNDSNYTLLQNTPIRSDTSEGNYIITYDPNGENVVLDAISITTGPTRRYSFINWNTSPNGSGTSYNPGDQYYLHDDLMLYAQWSSRLFAARATLPTPSREGYTCLGWSTSADANTAAYKPGDTITVNGNMTLFAVWHVLEEPEEPFSWTLENGVLTITGTGQMPDYSDDEAPWYSDSESVTLIVVGEGITEISAYAFTYCENAVSAVLPSSLSIIGESAFSECLNLQDITIPYGVTLIGQEAFSNCKELTGVEIPSSVTSIGNSAFSGCSSLTSITIPSSVTSIGSTPFGACTSLKQIHVSDENAYYCDLDGVLFNKNKTTIYCLPGGFHGEYMVPESVISIEDKAFWSCISLTGITIPSSVTSIGDRAFYMCLNLKSVVIPTSVTSIGTSCFSWCTKLTYVYYEGTETQWDDINIFVGNDELLNATIVYNFSAGEHSYIYPSSSVNEKKPTLTESGYITYVCTSCGESITEHYPVLNSTDYLVEHAKEATCSAVGCDKYTYLGNDALHLTFSVELPVVDHDYIDGVCRFCGQAEPNVPFDWTLENGTLTITGTGQMPSYNSGEAPWYDDRNSITSIVFGKGITEIGSYAFEDCSYANSVVLPSSLSIIGKSAFSNCSGLTNISFPVGLTTIADWAFVRCSGLTSITLPSGVAVGSYAFYRCGGLTKVTIPATVTSFGCDVFTYCDNLKSAGPIGGGYNLEFGWTESIPEKVFWDSSLEQISFPNGIISIGSLAFAGSNLQHVSIPSGLNTIGSNAFMGCNSLISAGPYGCGYDYEFPWTESIPEYAFMGCHGLTSIELPTTLTTIGRSAFSGTALSSISIPDSVSSIGGNAFQACRNLSTLNLPSSLTTISIGTFYQCSELISIGIPVSLTIIESNAFKECSALETIYYAGTEMQWGEISISNLYNDPLNNATIIYNYH